MDSNFRKGALAESARARKKKDGSKGGGGGGGGSDKNSNDMGHLKKSFLDVEEQRKGLMLGSMVQKIGEDPASYAPRYTLEVLSMCMHPRMLTNPLLTLILEFRFLSLPDQHAGRHGLFL